MRSARCSAATSAISSSAGTPGSCRTSSRARWRSRCSCWRARQRPPGSGWRSRGGLGSAIFLILYMPFTYSGGGGPVGNRYFLGVYPVFLFVTPPLASATSGAVVAGGRRAVHRAAGLQSVLRRRFDPASMRSAALYRWLPVGADAAQRPAGEPEPVAVEAAARRHAAVSGVLPRRQRLQPRGRCVLGARRVARGVHAARAGGRRRRARRARSSRSLRMPRLEVQLETGAAAESRHDRDRRRRRRSVEIPAHDRRSVTIDDAGRPALQGRIPSCRPTTSI